MATDLEFEIVLEFFRKNGFSECESALIEDVIEKSQLNASNFQKFLFPTVPPPPPVKIPSNHHLVKVIGDGRGGWSSKNSSDDDEFVSLGSSTTELCSDRPDSQTSSDRMSQFGTARNYADFDMQNDQLWYIEKDEDFAMPPLFDGREFESDPSEDKYIMTEQTENLTSYPNKDYFELGEIFHLEKSDEKHEECYGIEKFEVTDGGYDNTQDEGKYELVEDGVITDGPHEPEATVDEEGGAIFDELDSYDNKEEDFEIFELRIIHRKNRTGFEANKELPIILNSIIAGRYYITEYLGSAAFSRVVQAHDLYSGMNVCLKIIKNDKDLFDQSLDEIKLLKLVNKHDPADDHHILRLYDYFYHQEHLFIVTELLRANLYEFQKYSQESGSEPYFTMHRLQAITRQCLEALCYLHDLGIIHCDLKPENILIKSYRRCEVKVIDLGSSCFQTDNLSLYVQSRSYRATEVMLGLPYNQKIDLWSVGCILAELYSGEVLFPNEGVALLLARIVGVLGPIDIDMLRKGKDTHKYFTKEYDLFHLNEETNKLEYIIPEESSLEHHLQISDPVFVDFLKYLLEINPKKRPTAREALAHPWLSHPYEVNSC